MKIFVRHAIVLTVALLLAAVASAQQSWPVRATLALPDTKLLPGVPFDMWIDVSNPSDTYVTIGLLPTGIVPMDGQIFEIVPPGNCAPVLLPAAHQTLEEYRYLSLEAHEKKTLTLPLSGSGSFGSSAFFALDWRLMPPG